jgi:hypothetical protein
MAIKRGREEGAHGRPTADTPKYDVGETDVRNAVDTQLADVQRNLAAELQRIVPTIMKKEGELAQAELTFQTRKSAAELAQSLDGSLANCRTELEDAQFRKHEAEGHYNKFRLENNVTIDPDHPTDRVHYLSVVFIMLAVETALNAFFWGLKFGENFSLGIAMAFVIAAINISIGFVGGVCLSYKNLGDPTRKLLGWLGFILALVAAAGINYYVITKRETGVDQSVVNSAMFCIGMAFSLVAAYKGYRFFGSIPGYEAASSAFLNARNRVKAIEDELRQRIASDARGQEDLRNGVVRTVADIQVYFAKVRAEPQNLQMNFRITAQNLSTVLENVVGAYRSNNRATKGAMTPSPAWFDDPVERYPTESDSLNEALRTFNEVSARADSQSLQHREASKAEIAELQGVKTVYLGERVPQLLDTCNREGHKRFVESLGAVGNQGRWERRA